MEFAYTAIIRGERREGFVEASSEQEAFTVLQNQGLTPLTVTPAVRKRHLTMSVKSLAMFFRQFSALVKSEQILIPEALMLLANQMPRFKPTLENISKGVTRGEPLASAMKASGMFPKLATALLEVSEETGRRSEVLKELADHYMRENHYRAKVIRAVTYPAAALLLAILITWGMLTFIVPSMVGVLKDLNVPIPLPTRLLIGLSSVVSHPLTLLALPILYYVARLYWRMMKKDWQERIDQLLLKLPVVGTIVQKMLLARIARVIAMVHSAALPMQKALSMAAEVASNTVYSKALENVNKRITSQGVMLHEALAAYPDAFPMIFISLIRTGEVTGYLDDMLDHIASMNEEDVETTIDSLQSLLEPLLMVLIGIVVGGILLAVMLPYFSLAQGIATPGN